MWLIMALGGGCSLQAPVRHLVRGTGRAQDGCDRYGQKGAMMLFQVRSKVVEGSPRLYSGCGIKDVFLLSGFVEESDHRLKIAREQELRRLLGIIIIKRCAPLVPDDIRFLRRLMHLSQYQLADQLMLSRQSITRFEAGRQQLKGSLDILFRLHAALAVLRQGEREPVMTHILTWDGRHREREPIYLTLTPQGWAEARDTGAIGG